jgi:hypothetical protein
MKFTIVPRSSATEHEVKDGSRAGAAEVHYLIQRLLTGDRPRRERISKGYGM